MRAGGAKVGENVHIFSSTIDMGNLPMMEIGNDVTITEAIVLTHDACLLKKTGYIKVGKVIIGDNVFISKNCVVLPGVKIGSNVVVGAGVIVTKDIPDNSVIVGNPARVLSTYDEFLDKHFKRIENSPVFTSEEYKDNVKAKEIIKEFGYGYIKKYTIDK